MPDSLVATLNRYQPYAIGGFRIVVGFLFACHGAASLFGLLGTADNATVDAWTWPGWFAAVIQLVGGTLVMLGLGTRAAAFVSSGSMAYAYFKVHQPEALFPLENSGEASAMFCWALLLLVFTGPGAPALDNLLGRGGDSTPRATLPREHAPTSR
ncbi:DoxX family protein [Streptomyces qinzhouensis]|uniref:DoxX family protein n=1 Tax=Streptomyces qinzhouensis TaxID=2599401 RepID=A0A5B8J9K6_9ACTN|nr:DoxX family protein [Streptomyces qinzhouensis]QDY76561.1 DoxX family protein [Streptomyces qinzhouensis]